MFIIIIIIIFVTVIVILIIIVIIKMYLECLVQSLHRCVPNKVPLSFTITKTTTHFIPPFRNCSRLRPIFIGSGFSLERPFQI